MRTRLGSTDAAPILAALGLCESPWRSDHDVWRALRGAPQTAPSPAMLRGLACEPYLAARVAALLGETLTPVAPVTAPHGYEWLRISGDYRSGRRGYELKTSGHYAHQSWTGLPSYYEVQCVLEAWAFGFDDVLVPTLILPSWAGAAETATLTMTEAQREAAIRALAPVIVEAAEIQVYRVARDDDYAQAIVEHMERWWQRHVVEGVEPPVTATDAWAHFARVELRQRDPLRAAEPAEIALAERYVRAREAEKRAAEEKETIGAQLRAAIGTAAGIKTGHGYVVARAQSPRTNWKAAAQELAAMLGVRGVETADVLARHTTPSEGRTLAVEIDPAACGAEAA